MPVKYRTFWSQSSVNQQVFKSVFSSIERPGVSILLSIETLSTLGNSPPFYQINCPDTSLSPIHTCNVGISPHPHYDGGI